ncbi:MAG: zf-HC2 domain-containing protein [Actinomycetota bacterium]|jgi:anti-sigma factor RsiW|nr:zf-HC2 domain-containing protein [Actinomycetota bacterium]
MVSAYVDGEIRGSQAREVAEHLNRCWECRAGAQLLRLMKRSLRRLARPPATDVAQQAPQRTARATHRDHGAS